MEDNRTETVLIGCHLSASDGYEAMGKMAMKLGANTFAFFTRNPRGGKARELNVADVEALKQLMEENSFGTLVAHAPYTMNLCSDKAETRQFGIDMFRDDLQRMEYLPGQYYNFHPGSHVGQGVEKGTEEIVSALNEVLFPEMHTTVLLETMAGKGSEVGRSFEELRAILDGVDCREHLAVCLDTCHVWDGGYDLAGHLDSVLEQFDKVVGLEKLKAIHLNDSKNPCGAHKDRHELLGKGFIGADTLRAVVCHPALQKLPFILETPNDEAGYAREIAMVKAWRGEPIA